MLGQPVQERVPVKVQTEACTSPSGTSHGLLSLSLRSNVIILFQIGVAPVIPEAMADMGVLSLFPTHVATK